MESNQQENIKKALEFLIPKNTAIEMINMLREKPESYYNTLKAIQQTIEHNKEKFKQNVEKVAEKIDKISEQDEIYRPFSAILGAFFGDAIGSYFEFTKATPKNHDLIFKQNNIFGDNPGHVTDDSEMAMSQAAAIMDCPKVTDFNENFLYFYYGTWAKSQPKDIGNTIKKALKGFNTNSLINKCFDDNIKKQIKTLNEGSLANGSLMRNSPFCVWFYFTHKKKIQSILSTRSNDNNLKTKMFGELFQEIVEFARRDCCLTHPAFEIIAADSLVVFMAVLAMHGVSSIDIFNNVILLIKDKIFNNSGYSNLRTQVINYINEIKNKDTFVNGKYSQSFYTSFSGKCIGAYFHSMKLILFYLKNYEEYNKICESKGVKLMYQIMCDICDFGGDTDTNAAIVGCVMGPIIGFKNFGEKIKTVISSIDLKRIIYTNCLMYFYVYYIWDACKSLDTSKYLTMKTETKEKNLDYLYMTFAPTKEETNTETTEDSSSLGNVNNKEKKDVIKTKPTNDSSAAPKVNNTEKKGMIKVIPIEQKQPIDKNKSNNNKEIDPIKPKALSPNKKSKANEIQGSLNRNSSSGNIKTNKKKDISRSMPMPHILPPILNPAKPSKFHPNPHATKPVKENPQPTQPTKPEQNMINPLKETIMCVPENAPYMQLGGKQGLMPEAVVSIAAKHPNPLAGTTIIEPEPESPINKEGELPFRYYSLLLNMLLNDFN